MGNIMKLCIEVRILWLWLHEMKYVWKQKIIKNDLKITIKNWHETQRNGAWEDRLAEPTTPSLQKLHMWAICGFAVDSLITLLLDIFNYYSIYWCIYEGDTHLCGGQGTGAGIYSLLLQCGPR